jgi:hypothetical protein
MVSPRPYRVVTSLFYWGLNLLLTRSESVKKINSNYPVNNNLGPDVGNEVMYLHCLREGGSPLTSEGLILVVELNVLVTVLLEVPVLHLGAIVFERPPPPCPCRTW